MAAPSISCSARSRCSRRREARRHASASIALALAITFGAPWVAAGETPEATRAVGVTSQIVDPDSDLAVLGVTLNGATMSGVAYVARHPDRGLCVDAATLERLGLHVDRTALIDIDGQAFAVVASVTGVHAAIDARGQRLELTIDPRLFPVTLTAHDAGTTIAPQRPGWGGFANYALHAYAGLDANADHSAVEVGAALQAVVFGPRGRVEADLVVNAAGVRAAGAPAVLLLDAAWRSDDAARLVSWTFGDAITAAGSWGRPVRFAGVQYASNFALQPGFVTYPLLSASGIAAVPTVAELYANGVRLGGHDLPAGPFAITNVPALSGAGELQVVVTDAFGQQQVIRQPFYATYALLKPGLAQFSYSVGTERFDYGLRNLEYRGVIASGVYRRGMTDTLTLEARAESDRSIRGAGLAVDTVLFGAGVLHAGMSASQADHDGVGERVVLGFTRQAETVSLSATASTSSRDYREIGDSVARQTRAASASLNFALPRQLGTLALGLSVQRFADAAPDANASSHAGALGIAAMTYSRPLPGIGFFSLALTNTTGIAREHQVLASLTIPLGRGDMSLASTVQHTRTPDRSTAIATAEIQRALPAGEGFGFYARAATDRTFTGGASYNAALARYSIEASSVNGASAARATVEGGVGVVGDKAFLARPMEQSFALVKVGDVAGARVLLDNIDVGRTGPDGALVVTAVPAYTPVTLALDPTTLPLGNTMPVTERRIVVMERTGVIVSFASAAHRDALVRLSDIDGVPLPAGASVRVQGRTQRYPVGEGGEVYIDDVEDTQELEVTHLGRRCRVALTVAAGSGAVADVGPLVCQLVKVQDVASNRP